MLIEGGEAGTHRPGVVGRLRIERPDVLLIKAAGEPSEEVDMEDSQDAGKEMVIAEGSEPQVDVIPRRKDTRPAGVPGWSFKVCHINSICHEHILTCSRLAILLCSLQMQTNGRTTHPFQ